MIYLIATLIFLKAHTFGSEKQAVYDSKPPRTFCTDAARIDGSVKSCADNSIFLRSARECRQKFDRLKRQVLEQARKRIGSGGNNQLDNFSDQERNTSEAAKAHGFLIAVGTLAVKELDDYFDFLEHPADAETDEEVEAEPCFMETAKPLSDLVGGLEDEVDQMRAAMGAETAISGLSDRRGNQMNQLGPPSSSTSPRNSASPTPSRNTGTKRAPPSNRESDVTGERNLRKNTVR